MSAEVAESPVKRIKVRHRGNRAMLAKIETMLSKAHFQEIREMYRKEESKGDLSSYPSCDQAHQGAPAVGAKEMQKARRGSAEQAL